MLTQYVTSQRVMFYNCNTFTQQHLIIKNAIARRGLHLLYAWEKSPSRPLAHFLSLPLFYSISLFASLTGRNYSYSIEKKFFQLFQKLLLMIYKTYTVKKEKKHYIFLLCILPLHFPFANANLHINRFYSFPNLGINKFKYATHPRYTVIMKRF